MKDLIKFLIFLSYIISIFFLQNAYYLLIVLTINILLMIYYKVNFKLALKNILNLSVFILITVVINFFVQNLKYAILIGIRLILVCNVTYIFSKRFTYMQFVQVIKKILYPLQIFKIDVEDISLIICIALAFIPILKDELLQIKYSLFVKGFKFSFINVIKNMKLIFKPLFISIMRRVDEMEKTLKVKGYQE